MERSYENVRNEDRCVRPTQDLKVREDVPMISTKEVAQDNRMIAIDLRGMAGRIHGHLFGAENGESCDKVAEPRCIQEELQQTQRELKGTYEML